MIPEYSSPLTFNDSSYPADQRDTSEQLAWTIAEAVDDRKGGDIILLRVAEVSSLADYFVIATGFSKPQVRAIAQAVEDAVGQRWHRYPLRKEGEAESSWVVQDYGEVIVHTMMPRERLFYNLEAFWAHAEQIDFSSDSAG